MKIPLHCLLKYVCIALLSIMKIRPTHMAATDLKPGYGFIDEFLWFYQGDTAQG